MSVFGVVAGVVLYKLSRLSWQEICTMTSAILLENASAYVIFSLSPCTRNFGTHGERTHQKKAGSLPDPLVINPRGIYPTRS